MQDITAILDHLREHNINARGFITLQTLEASIQVIDAFKQDASAVRTVT